MLFAGQFLNELVSGYQILGRIRFPGFLGKVDKFSNSSDIRLRSASKRTPAFKCLLLVRETSVLTTLSPPPGHSCPMTIGIDFIPGRK